METTHARPSAHSCEVALTRSLIAKAVAELHSRWKGAAGRNFLGVTQPKFGGLSSATELQKRGRGLPRVSTAVERQRSTVWGGLALWLPQPRADSVVGTLGSGVGHGPTESLVLDDAASGTRPVALL